MGRDQADRLGQPVNPLRVMETGEEIVPIYGSRQWEKLNQAERDELSRHLSSWLFTSSCTASRAR